MVWVSVADRKITKLDGGKRVGNLDGLVSLAVANI